MMLIKLGGSVITDKRRIRTFRKDIAGRLFRELREFAQDAILVHGAGSFGHILASKYRLQDGLSSKGQLKGVSKVQADVRELNLKLIRIAGDMGMSLVSIPPAAMVLCENKRIVEFNDAPFLSSLKSGLIPVTFGDVVFDRSLGFCICSGDDLMLHLAKRFRPEKAVFVADTDGVFDRDPKAHKDARLLRRIDQKALDDMRSHAADCSRCRNVGTRDATGGLARKVEIMLEISRLGVDSVLLNGLKASRLKECLTGRRVVGTSAKGSMGSDR